jgi:hypothetical protein
VRQTDGLLANQRFEKLCFNVPGPVAGLEAQSSLCGWYQSSFVFKEKTIIYLENGNVIAKHQKFSYFVMGSFGAHPRETNGDVAAHPEQDATPGRSVMVFYPTMEEMASFSKYIDHMEAQGAHLAGIAKVSL